MVQNIPTEQNLMKVVFSEGNEEEKQGDDEYRLAQMLADGDMKGFAEASGINNLHEIDLKDLQIKNQKTIQKS